MADQQMLNASVRTDFGKGAARRLRREGKLPGVLYGHGQDVLHLTLDTHEVFLAIKGATNVLLDLKVDGESHLALVKDVQVDPVRRTLEHIDLVIIRRGEKVNVEVPIITEGEVKGHAIATVELLNLHLNVPATSIPEHIVINVDGLEEGDVVRVGDVELPADAECEDDPEDAIVVVTVPQEEPEPETEESATEDSEAGEAEEDSAEEADSE